MGITGGAMLTISVGMALASVSHLFEPGSDADYGSAPDVLAAGGGLLCVASVAFIIASRKNKKRQGYICKKKP